MKFILQLFFLSCIAFSTTRLYLGTDDNGKLLAGVEASIYIEGFRITSYVESRGLRYAGRNFIPKEIFYVFRLDIKEFGWEHGCSHGVDGPVEQEQYDKFWINYLL